MNELMHNIAFASKIRGQTTNCTKFVQLVVCPLSSEERLS
jgi:hypothetical protein